jgi:site-specific DNA recombinase
MERVYKKQRTRKKGSEPSDNPTGKLRIAAYVRTSTMMISQETSFETQVETFRKKIESNPDWALVEIFADHGISGTQAKKRRGIHADA